MAAAAMIVPWYRNRASLVAIFAFALTTMLNESILDLYQFYATSTPCPFPDRGPALNAGLCLDVTKTSLTVAVGGAGVVAFSLFAYPPLQRRFGVAFCCKFGLFVGAIMCMVFATARYALPLGAGPLLAVLVVAQLLYGVGFSATSTASMIMVNLCAPPGQVGAVNGAANLLMSASRIVGPYIVGASFFSFLFCFYLFFCRSKPEKRGENSLFPAPNKSTRRLVGRRGGIRQARPVVPFFALLRSVRRDAGGIRAPGRVGRRARLKKRDFFSFLSCFLVLRIFKKHRRPYLFARLLGTSTAPAEFALFGQ
jgi:MFS family permease